MERADWLDGAVDSADARFLMVTAITHHRFSSPIWGAREVRKLQAELAEIARHAAVVLQEHQTATAKSAKPKRPRPRYRGVFGAPAW
jgi:3-deoxy-D-arabino-heptulosonate 7-phosphate (DAHP) synthase class II